MINRLCKSPNHIHSVENLIFAVDGNRAAMISFLNSTSMHGLSKLVDQNKLQKVFWGLTCLSAFTCLVYFIVDLCDKYHSPENLKTLVTIDQSLSKSLITEKRLQQDIFPSIILCAADPTTNLSKYKQIQIIKNGNSTRLPPLRPMYVSKVGQVFNAFKGFGMCAKLFENQIDNTWQIKWNGVGG